MIKITEMNIIDLRSKHVGVIFILFIPCFVNDLLILTVPAMHSFTIMYFTSN